MSTGDPPRGFAGLIQLASSDAIPARPVAPPPAPPATPQAAQRPPLLPRKSVQPSPKLDKRGSGRWLGVWGGLIVVLIVAMIVLVRCAGSEPEADQAPTVPTDALVPSTPEPAPAPVPIEPPVTRLAESVPSVGTGLVLSRDEIRYCLSEHIRLETWATQVDKDSHTAVTAFNAAIDDYNSRCSHYKYRQGALDSVRAEVEDTRSVLVDEGMQRAAAHR